MDFVFSDALGIGLVSQLELAQNGLISGALINAAANNLAPSIDTVIVLNEPSVPTWQGGPSPTGESLVIRAGTLDPLGDLGGSPGSILFTVTRRT